MNARPGNRLETRFEAHGTLPPPGTIGRIVRFALGLWLLTFLYQLVTLGPSIFIDQTAPNRWEWWLAGALGIMVTPYVVNIGFGQNWKHWPRTAAVATALALIAVDLAVYRTWWAPPLGVFALVWFVYWVGHLGVSFLLSAFLATPGCEMRAAPHLWTLMSGIKTREHYCPGFLDNLDRWERERST